MEWHISSAKQKAPFAKQAAVDAKRFVSASA